MKPLSIESVRFRSELIDAIEKLNQQGIGYKDGDTFDARCPVCDDTLVVHFHGAAPRADLDCYGGCSEAEVTEALQRVAS